MLIAAMLVDALHATFEDAEIAFNGIGRHIAARIFLLRVVDAFMAGKLQPKARVVASLVCHEAAFARRIGHDELPDILGRELIDFEGTGATAALNQGNDLQLAADALLALPAFAIDKDRAAWADISLVRLNDLVLA